MNRVPVIIPNPAYIGGVELDEDEVDPADLTPLISGNTPIVTVPASEDEDEYEKVEDVPHILRVVIQGLEGLNRELRSIWSLGDTSSQQHTVVPNVDVCDTGKALEEEYRLYTDPTMEEVRDRLSNQVWDLLQIMQERVDQNTCNNIDMKLIEGLKAITVMHTRLSSLTEKVLKPQAEKP